MLAEPHFVSSIIYALVASPFGVYGNLNSRIHTLKIAYFLCALVLIN
jgi:hypothetical protein